MPRCAAPVARGIGKVDCGRAEKGVAHRIEAGATVEMIRPGRRDQRVVPGKAADEVVAGRARQRIGEIGALKRGLRWKRQAGRARHLAGRAVDDRKARQRQQRWQRKIGRGQRPSVRAHHREDFAAVADHDTAQDGGETQLLEIAQIGQKRQVDAVAPDLEIEDPVRLAVGGQDEHVCAGAPGQRIGARAIPQDIRPGAPGQRAAGPGQNQKVVARPA